MIEKLIIIGSGPAGLTAGIYAARANLNPLIIDGLEPGGQLMGTSIVENWPSDTQILGPNLMGNMRNHAQNTGCRFKSGEIEKADFTKTPFEVITNKQEKLSASSIIIATGATPKRLGIPGEQEYWGKGVGTCAVCDGFFYKDKPVVIVGGGDTAMEDASVMTSYTKQITILQLGPALTASPIMQERILHDPAVTIKYNRAVSEIKGNGSHVSQIVFTDTKTKKQETIDTDAVFLAIGLKPNTGAFKGQLALEKNGYITVSNHTHTSVPGVFVAGDVADYRYRQAITAAGSGCMAALDAAQYLKLH